MLSNTIYLLSACLVLFIMSFCSQECFAMEQIEVKANTEKVGRYEKIEFQISLNNVYSNPFDPDEVDLVLEIETPDGKAINLPAFYYQDYEQRYLDKDGRSTDWLYPIEK